MKIRALKSDLFLIIVSIIAVPIDVYLIIKYGFEKEIYFFYYSIIAVIPICSITSVCKGLAPTLIFKNNAGVIEAKYIANDVYYVTRKIIDSYILIYYDEINGYNIDGIKLTIKLKYEKTQTLRLNFFTKKQIMKICKELDKIIEKNVKTTNYPI